MLILIDSLHLVFTAAFCSLLWVVQVLVYPQFSAVGRDHFANYHAKHMQRMMPPVGVIFLGEGTTAAISFVLLVDMQPFLQSASVLLFAFNALLTFLIFVPLHQKLQAQVSEPLLRRLVRLNWLRTICSSARLGVVVAITVG